MKKYVDLDTDTDQVSTIFSSEDDLLPQGEYRAYHNKTTGVTEIFRVPSTSYTVIDAARDGVVSLLRWIGVVCLSIVVLGLASAPTFVTGLDTAGSVWQMYLYLALMAGIGVVSVFLFSLTGWGFLALPGCGLVFFILSMAVPAGTVHTVAVAALNVLMGLITLFGALPGLLCLLFRAGISALGALGEMIAPVLAGVVFGFLYFGALKLRK